MALWVYVVALVCVGHVSAGPKCTGSPRKYNGKDCASTTHYADYHKGSCGCGPSDGDNQFGWNHAGFNVAANQWLFDQGGGGWCGPNCGKCIRLTTTGGWVDNQGGPTKEGQSKVFMITNDCPNEYPNLSWCSQSLQTNYLNPHGYGWHFDLEDGVGQVTGMGWNNPEVTWEWFSCEEGHNDDGRTPNGGMFQQCYCQWGKK